eukprot:CAMPEP_0179313840 /NCGR_PEP_ID=MMETSP0797-20121207/54052_1 /TAXON_ID=47934 /ORGANISM="Dinophysis acuminata, Strain DAEP01" /LENGTH=92 /DNA_ID=CAMNT_0021023943 /DNA_START=517 /DNA_END=792 /DNA_ORIENTATION=+
MLRLRMPLLTQRDGEAELIIHFYILRKEATVDPHVAVVSVLRLGALDEAVAVLLAQRLDAALEALVGGRRFRAAGALACRGGRLLPPALAPA